MPHSLLFRTSSILSSKFKLFDFFKLLKFIARGGGVRAGHDRPTSAPPSPTLRVHSLTHSRSLSLFIFLVDEQISKDQVTKDQAPKIQVPENPIGHNSSSRRPLETLSSALDRIFQTTSIEHGFRANALQEKQF